jgi:UDP-N-acetylmuramate dehydrogenase
MFKNPPNDYAGRLIEACGLKGHVIGGAMISPVHANFFVNNGNATASDVKALIDVARESVAREFAIDLELEVELIGEWKREREFLEIDSA